MGYHFAQADAEHIPLADGSVDLTFCSPPYLSARTYGIGAQRDCAEWVDWMLKVVTEACRVTSGVVLVNCAGVTRNRIYQPGPEGLLYEWHKRGGVCWRPAYWRRVGIPGSGGRHWLRADVEYLLCFKRTKDWPDWSDNTACGHPPKWGPGGEMSHRLTDGARVNQWGGVGSSRGFGSRKVDGEFRGNGRPSHAVSHFKRHTKSRPDGRDEIQTYFPPVLANPGTCIEVEEDGPHSELKDILDGDGTPEEILAEVRQWMGTSNVIDVPVGGGKLGSDLAHENEAPFPVKLAEFFIKSFCPPGGKVLDMFSGSGTTVDAARRLGRTGIGFDLRMSQCELGRRRLATPVTPKAVKPKKRVELKKQAGLLF